MAITNDTDEFSKTVPIEEFCGILFFLRERESVREYGRIEWFEIP